MPNDAYTLSFLSLELNRMLKGGKINKITQPESDEIALSIYAQNQAHRLLISAGRLQRMHLTKAVKENPQASFNFLMSLRKHLTGAEIVDIKQVTYERIIIIEFLSKSELKDSETFHLYAELMGKYSNIILTDKNGKILSSAKTAPLDSVRPVFAGFVYKLPPAMDNCRLDEIEKIKEKLKCGFEENLQDYLCKVLRGIAKSSALEIIQLSNFKGGKLSKDDIESLINSITEFDGKSKKNEAFPCLIHAENSTDVYPYVYKSVEGKVENFENLNLALDEFYGKKDSSKRIEEKSKHVRQVIKNNVSKLNKKIALFNEKLMECTKKEDFRIYGDLITSNIHKISKNDEVLTCPNFFDDNKEIKIKLDKILTPSKNAQNYYKKYNKLKTAELYATGQLKQAVELKEYFLSVEYALSNCTETSEINEIAEELKKEGFLAENKTGKKPNSKETTYKPVSYKISGFTIYAGKNNLQNDYLTFKIAKPNDIWLHAKGHGSHVIIAAENKTVPDEIIKAAASIAAYNSEAKNSLKVEIDYTFKKHVKKPSGAKAGFVTYTDYKSIYVEPKEYQDLKSK